MPGRRVNVYVDGFNLYYGSLKGTHYKWLDLSALADHLLPQEMVKRVRYFSARVTGIRDPGAPARQESYLRAVRMDPRITVHLGTFLSNDRSMHLARPPRQGTSTGVVYLKHGGARYAWVIRTEEKGSDVNLAAYLMLDAFDQDCDLALIISNDSDLMEPIRLVRERFFPVGVVSPHPIPSRQLA